jgi:hypothetical protein
MTTEQEASEESVVVTDDMLSSAADAAVEAEEVVEEETTEEETEEVSEEETTEEETSEETEVETEEESTEEEAETEEPESPAERSRLGRKVKNLETQLQTALDQIKSLTTAKPATEEEETLDEDDFVKASDIPKLIEKEREKEQSEKTAYQASYLNKILEIGNNEGMDEALQDEIFEEMQSNFNQIHGHGAEVDSEINFRKAQAAIATKKMGEIGKPKNPLKGGKSKVATGVGGGTETEVKPAKPAVKLDAHAAEFIKDSGLSIEEAADVLTSDEKPHLSFHRG